MAKESMEQPVVDPTRRRMSKLVRVLVLGGAVLAASASAATLRGDLGSPSGDKGDGGTDGGTPGW